MVRLADGDDRRLDAAVDVVPELAAYADGAARRSSTRLRDLDDVTVQRIHGDLHLGQTLRTVKGWKIVDFEGEPAKPLAERSLPDSRVARRRRDAAVVRLRAAGGRAHDRATTTRPAPSSASYRAAEWAERNRRRFLEAYAGRRADRRRGDPARGLRGRQGGLRGGLRGPQPPELGVHPARAIAIES